jgi:Calcineurin-like phosphoesterase
MRLQLLSDLHLETEAFEPEPASGAELLVLAGDICSRWQGLARFAGWPVPVIFVAGNHEFDDRDVALAWPVLRAHCDRLGIRMLERETCTLTDRAGRRIRFVATIRWSDFDLFGADGRPRAMRAAGYFMRLMGAGREGKPFDAEAIREEALACREWLAAELARTDQDCDATVAITHFAPSLRSADPRYGGQAGTASFCNADDNLLVHADLWIHGHLHCRHDYVVQHPGGRRTRVVSNARGHSPNGESRGYDGGAVFDV